jgi:hypothetical protein
MLSSDILRCLAQCLVIMNPKGPHKIAALLGFYSSVIWRYVTVMVRRFETA